MAEHPICYLEVINDVGAIKTWGKQFRTQLGHLSCDNETAVTIFQAGRGRAKQLWLICTSNDINLAVGYIAGELLISSAHVLRYWHMGQQYKDCVNMLIKDQGGEHYLCVS